MTGDRIPCINPRCRRTAPAEKYEDCSEIVGGKCWKLLPKSVTERYKALRKRERRILRLIDKHIKQRGITADRVALLKNVVFRHHDRNWAAIRGYFLNPEKPEGLDAFLEEMNLK